MKTLQGIAASPGIAIGPAFRFQKTDLRFECYAVQDPSAEWARFQTALETASAQLADVCAQAEAESGADDAAIFQAHALMLDDPELLDAVRTAIEEQCVNAESALNDAAGTYIQLLESLDDEYLSARAADVRDVADRVLRILLDVAESPTANLTTPSVILARDLTPSDTVLLDKSLVLGFCTAEGGPTAHTAILARGLGLPAIVGIGPDILEVEDHTTLILDGGSGTLVVEPDEKGPILLGEPGQRLLGDEVPREVLTALGQHQGLKEHQEAKVPPAHRVMDGFLHGRPWPPPGPGTSPVVHIPKVDEQVESLDMELRSSDSEEDE